MNFSLSLNDRVHGFHGCNINPTIELFYRPFGLEKNKKSWETMSLHAFRDFVNGNNKKISKYHKKCLYFFNRHICSYFIEYL